MEALIWSSLWHGKMWDFVLHLEHRPDVGNQIGISHIPPRPVALYTCVMILSRRPGPCWTALPQAVPKSYGVGSFLSPRPCCGPGWASAGLVCALWPAHAAKQWCGSGQTPWVLLLQTLSWNGCGAGSGRGRALRAVVCLRVCPWPLG